MFLLRGSDAADRFAGRMRAVTHDSAKRVMTVYLVTSGLFVLSTSLIWATNTVFLMRIGGLTIFHVMLVNSVFTVGQAIFEVPTGVIADTLGRRFSYLSGIAMILMSTVMYAVTPSMGWGIGGFIVASALLGLGFTLHTGTVEAWLVDALDYGGYTHSKEGIFASGQIAAGVGMLSGSLLGGLIGQVNLVLPYLVRAGLLGVVFVIVWFSFRDLGFEARPFSWSSLGSEAKEVFVAGLGFGWRSPVIRPMFIASALVGVFFVYAFYAWQPYVLELLKSDKVWFLGVVQAAISLAGMAGNAVASRVRRRVGTTARLLEMAAWGGAALAAAIGAVGLVGISSPTLAAGVAVALWIALSFVFGLTGPVRMAYLNEQIPTQQRATVLSIDAFFADAGATAGQPALGRISERASISVAWLIGSAFVAASAPFYRKSGRALRESER